MFFTYLNVFFYQQYDTINIKIQLYKEKRINELEKSLKKLFLPVTGLLDTIRIRQKIFFASSQLAKTYIIYTVKYTKLEQLLKNN